MPPAPVDRKVTLMDQAQRAERLRADLQQLELGEFMKVVGRDLAQKKLNHGGRGPGAVRRRQRLDCRATKSAQTLQSDRAYRDRGEHVHGKGRVRNEVKREKCVPRRTKKKNPRIAPWVRASIVSRWFRI